MKKSIPPKSAMGSKPAPKKKKSKALGDDPKLEKQEKVTEEPKKPAPKKSRTIGDEPDLKKQFKDARNKVPKYLFRMWSTASGGNKSLNSTERVAPHGFHYHSGHNSMFDLTREKLEGTARDHVYAETITDTEFSSWAASPRFVLRYALSHQHHDAHIAIIDTEELSNSMFHVPALNGILRPGKSPVFRPYREEYLVHGVVTGNSYKAVSLKSLLSAGLATQLSTVNKKSGAHTWAALAPRMSKTEPVIKVTEQEARAMRDVGKLYGPKFYIPFTIGLICLKKRSNSSWEDIGEDEAAMILRVLHRKDFPDWSNSPGIVADSLYEKSFEDNSQMYHLMRALRDQAFGKGARARAAAVIAAGGEQSRIFDLDRTLDKLSISRDGPS